MVRIVIAVPLLALAACGGGEEKAAEVPATMPTGQYEVVAAVTEFRPGEDGEPKVSTPVGTRTTRSLCANAAEPPADLFADEGETCSYASPAYARGGTINVTLNCTRPGLNGAITYSVDGSYTADGFEANRRASVLVDGPGDSNATATLTGRRTGECQPAGPATPAPAPAG